MRFFDRLPTPSDRAMRILWAVLLILTLVIIGKTVLDVRETTQAQTQRLDDARDAREQLERTNAEQDEAIAARDEALGDANAKLKDAGEPPVEVPDEPVAVPDEGGGLTSSDVLALIRAEVDTLHPDLTRAQREAIIKAAAVAAAKRIPEPEDGQDAPTLEDMRPVIAAEVAKIPAPDDGQDGRTPTAQEVTAAIEALCGGSCVGPQGPAGPPGPAGPAGPAGSDGQDGDDGRSIASVTCGDSDDWTIHYSDGTSETVAGPCRIDQPEPEPSTTSPTPDPSSTSPQG